jgi:hypothetical protein
LEDYRHAVQLDSSNTQARESVERIETELARGGSAAPESDDSRLQECLSFYLRCHGGVFMPEGRSNAYVKSRSDTAAMCAFAIGHQNYYWRYFGSKCP